MIQEKSAMFKIFRQGLVIILFFFIHGITVYAQNELNVIKDSWLEHSDSPNALYHYLTDQANEFLQDRQDKIAKLSGLEDWQKWQSKIRLTLNEIAGPFPEKTPLNAKTVRIIEKPDFRVEHIIYESVPGFYVTSSLYLPKGIKKGKKAPAVIYCSGHTVEGYRSDVYQHVILNLVMKGFIVFAFDPVGQGERLEYYDPKTGKSTVGGPTKEHSYPGAQAFLTGGSQAHYMIWDGIRAVDYLFTRKEVDNKRIGITGRSGGGTQSAYISAFDDRIYAAAPENYLTNYKRLLQTIGPQDAEQNMFNIIARGLDHPDFLIVRAPKPSLMITTTRDMFSIQGAMETEREVKKIYRSYGQEDSFLRAEDDAPHASTVKNREAMYAFFQKHLNNPGNQEDEEIIPLTKDEMRVTEAGQVSVSLGGETVFSLNRKIAEDLAAGLNLSRKNPSVFLPEVISSSKRLSGFRDPDEVAEPVFAGRLQKENYAIEKYFIKGEGNYIIPYLLFKPDNPGNKVMIFLHPGSKTAEAAPGGVLEKFINQGITVLAPDLLGIGEMGPGIFRGDAYFDGSSHNLWYAAMLAGRSITGIRAGDVVMLLRMIKKSYGEKEIVGCAVNELAPVMLHSAAFEKSFDNVVLIQPYMSFMSLVMSRFYDPVLIQGTVPGALTAYDLPDLAATLSPRKLLIAGITDGNRQRIADVENSGISFIRSVYKNKNSEGNFKIVTEGTSESLFSEIQEWLK